VRYTWGLHSRMCRGGKGRTFEDRRGNLAQQSDGGGVETAKVRLFGKVQRIVATNKECNGIKDIGEKVQQWQNIHYLVEVEVEVEVVVVVVVVEVCGNVGGKAQGWNKGGEVNGWLVLAA